MNRKLTSRHIIISMFVDYMMSTGHYSKLRHSMTEINMKELKRIMVKESEFPIYTPTNVLFLIIILGMINNQVSLLNHLKNINRDLEADSWIDIISQVVELRSFGKENSSQNNNFYIYPIQKLCELYPKFHPSVHKFIKEELFMGIDEIQEMFPYFVYSSIATGPEREYQLIAKWPELENIESYYRHFKEEHLTNYQERIVRVFSLPFHLSRRVSPETAEFFLYSLSFHFVSVSWDKFEYLNDNYNV